MAAEYNILEYPHGYFNVQVQFALKWSMLSGDPLSNCLLNKTALYRRITSVSYDSEPMSELWSDTFARFIDSIDHQEISGILYDVYKQQPHSKYETSRGLIQKMELFGTFTYHSSLGKNREDGLDSIKIHFMDAHRVKGSGLHPTKLRERKNDLKRMFTEIKIRHPSVKQVISASWLYHKKTYREIFPPEFVKNLLRLVPEEFGDIPHTVPNMSLMGNSVWGQFVNHQGWMNRSRESLFIKNIKSASDLEDLVNAFPLHPMIAKSNIDVFYRYYQVNRRVRR